VICWISVDFSCFRTPGDFRSGRQSVAEFWINFQNKFVHIRYLAVRNDEGKYLGTVELTQDLAPLRQSFGERSPSELKKLKVLPADATAPTCQTCHMQYCTRPVD
jgi:hypothetical protein